VNLPDEVLAVADNLKELRDKVVFVGGMVRGALVTDPAVPGPRPTKDVDLILDVQSAIHRVEIEERIRELGFRVDMSEGAPICRYVLRGAAPDGDDIPVDFMPLDPSIFGFSNVWYPDAYKTSQAINTASGPIRLIDAPHFLATKPEAFAARGGGDYYHHDLEDVVVLVDGRSSLLDEVTATSKDLRNFIGAEIGWLLSLPEFVESLAGHLPGDAASQARLPLLLARLEGFAALAGAAEVLTASEEAARPVVSVELDQARRTQAPEDQGGLLSWTPIRSSNVRHFSYAPDTRVLTVVFNQGRTYEYYEVPRQVFEGWKQAASAGRYHHQWIRGRYRDQRVAG
jgi:hypothetical protein